MSARTALHKEKEIKTTEVKGRQVQQCFGIKGSDIIKFFITQSKTKQPNN